MMPTFILVSFFKIMLSLLVIQMCILYIVPSFDSNYYVFPIFYFCEKKTQLKSLLNIFTWFCHFKNVLLNKFVIEQ